MMKALTWLFAFWPKLPKMIQVAIAVAIAICIVALPLTVIVFTLKDGSLQNTLGMVATQENLEDVATDIKSEGAETTTAIVTAAINELRDSLSTVEDTVKKKYLEPIVFVLKDLQKRTGRLEHGQGEANTSLDAISETSAAQMRHLEAIAQDDTKVDLQGMMKREFANINGRLDEQQQQLEELKSKRTSKVRIP